VPLNPAKGAAQKEANVFKEPKTKWQKSKAKKILYEALFALTGFRLIDADNNSCPG
jgi:hypothetical protein